MNFSISESRASSVEFDKQTMWVELLDGRVLGVPLAYFPKLMRASERQKQKYILSGGGIGIHWEHLDEDISVAGLLLGFGDQTVHKKESLLQNQSSLAV